MGLKSWNWKRIVLNIFIIISGVYFSNIVDVNKLAVGIVYCGMIMALVFLNKE